MIVLRNILSILLVCFGLSVSGQISTVSKTHDFGNLTGSDVRYADFEFVNNSGKDAFLLRIDNDPATSYLFKDRNFPTGSTYVLRVQYNPKKKGPFEVKINVYFSLLMDPIVLTLMGNLSEMPSNRAQECPTFDEQHSAGFKATFALVDAETGARIEQGDVIVLGNGGAASHKVNRKGEVILELNPGLYKGIGTAEGYEMGENQGYINQRNPIIEIPLTREIIEESVVEPEVIAEVPATEPEPVVNVAEEEISVEEPIEEVIDSPMPEEVVAETIAPPEPKPIPARDLANANFVFLVDVSSSMAKYGKLDLLQTTLLSIVPELGEDDRISLVKYASNAYVMIDSLSSKNKQLMVDSVNQLTAHGFTKGQAGLFLSYEIAKKNYIEGGINQVIVLTDGGFNLDTDDANLVKLVKQYAKAGIQLTIVGVKASRQATPSLIALEKAGKGALIEVRDEDGAQKLLLEHWKQVSW